MTPPHPLRVWLVTLDELSHASAVMDMLADDELRRAHRFRLPRLGRRYAAGRAALRIVLGAALDIDPRDVPLAAGPTGKPRLAHRTTLSFNLSHCEGTAAIAIATAGDVGVDVESSARVHEPQRVATRFFDAREAKTIACLPPALAAQAFVRCWTAKEAVLKAIGVGLTRPLHEVVVSADPDTPLRLRRVPAPLRPSDWTLHAVRLPGRLTVATAVSVPGVPPPEVLRLEAARPHHLHRGKTFRTSSAQR